MNYFEVLPIEIYKKIINGLDPHSLISICLSDKYNLELSQDESLWENYVTNYYNPRHYGLDIWTKKNLNEKLKICDWKMFVKQTYTKLIHIRLKDGDLQYKNSQYKKLPIRIYCNDTFEQIWDRYYKIISLESSFSESISLQLFFKNSYRDIYNVSYGPNSGRCSIDGIYTDEWDNSSFLRDSRYRGVDSNSTIGTCGIGLYNLVYIQGPYSDRDPLNKGLDHPTLYNLQGFPQYL